MFEWILLPHTIMLKHIIHFRSFTQYKIIFLSILLSNWTWLCTDIWNPEVCNFHILVEDKNGCQSPGQEDPLTLLNIWGLELGSSSCMFDIGSTMLNFLQTYIWWIAVLRASIDLDWGVILYTKTIFHCCLIVLI